MKAFAGFKNEVWCMDLAYVDKLAKNNSSVKSLLVLQDLFEGAVNAKRMKTIIVQRNGSCVFNCKYEKESTHKILGQQGNRICCKKLCKAQ